VTERIRARAEHFLPVSGMNDRQLAERIRHDGIDILIDLNRSYGGQSPAAVFPAAGAGASHLARLSRRHGSADDRLAVYRCPRRSAGIR